MMSLHLILLSIRSTSLGTKVEGAIVTSSPYNLKHPTSQTSSKATHGKLCIYQKTTLAFKAGQSSNCLCTGYHEYSEYTINDVMDSPSPRKSYAALQVPTAVNHEHKPVDLTSVQNSLLNERDNIIKGKESMESEIFQNQLKEILNKSKGPCIRIDLSLFKHSRNQRVIEQDIVEEIEGHWENKWLWEQVPELEFFKRTYANSLVPRVMGSSGKQTKPWNRHDQRQFREEVLESYNFIDGGIS